MKKTILTVILALVATLCLCFGLAACGESGGNGGSTGGSQTEQGGTQQGGGTQPGGGTEPGGETQPGGTEQTEEYTVTFDANGGTFAEGTTLTQTAKENAKLNSPQSPTRNNYDFAGWTKTKDGTDFWQFGSDAVTGDVTLYAAWEQSSAILLSVEGASIEGTEVFLYVEPETEEVNLTGGKVVCSEDSTWHLYRKGSESEIYTKTASSLVGGNNEFRIVVASKDGENVNTYNFTVHRKYMVDVTYMTNDTVFETKQVMTGATLTEEEYDIACEVKGYTFNYWEPDLAFGETILAPVIVQANLTANKYKLIYDANGGTSSLGEIEYDMDSVITIDSGESFTRHNYTLLSFNTQRGGLGEKFEFGAEFKFDRAEDITLYAIWDCDFTLSFSPTTTITGVKRQKEVISLDGLYEEYTGSYKYIDYISVNAFKNDTVLREITIPKRVEIPGGAFSGCSNLTSMTIGYNSSHPLGYFFGEKSYDGSTRVPQKNNTVFYYIPTSLRSISFEGSTEIPEYALDHIESIKVVSIPATVTSIGLGAFLRSGIEEVHITDFTAWYNIEREGGFGQYRLYLNNSELTELQIPADAKEIPAYLCNGWAGLKKVTGGSGVTSIGKCAFEDCTGLTSLEISDSVTSIGSYAFAYCSGLKSVTIPNKVTTIGQEAFKNCTRLQSVTIGEGVTEIGEWAFYKCSGLESVVWNAENCTSAGGPSSSRNPFMECNKLQTATFGDKVKTIPANAFYESHLTSVTISASVTEIGGYAFYQCTRLKKVYYKGTPTDWGGISRGDGNNALTKETLHYFSAQTPTAEQWQESENWWHYDGDGTTIVLWTKEQA